MYNVELTEDEAMTVCYALIEYQETYASENASDRAKQIYQNSQEVIDNLSNKLRDKLTFDCDDKAIFP